MYLALIICVRINELAVADQPVQRGKVLALGKLLVQSPKYLDDTKGGRRHGVTEITARGGHGSDNP